MVDWHEGASVVDAGDQSLCLVADLQCLPGEPTKVSVEVVRETEKKEASAEQLPATESPKTMSSLTTSRQINGSAS